MRSHPGSYHLSFLLPKGMVLRPGIEAAFAAPDCSLLVIHPLVKIYGRSREAVFGFATDLLRLAERPPRPVSIAATLDSPAPGSGSDPWSIIVGADVAFSPTSLDPHFPRLKESPCPAPAANEKTDHVIQAGN